MKFDCVKVSGKVDYVRSVDRMNGGHKATVSIDGAVIPNLQVSNKLYEELEVGESVTLYGLFKRNNEKKKTQASCTA
ncbi:hypothetical protein V5O39_04010 [Pseudomonas parakoreensis]